MRHALSRVCWSAEVPPCSREALLSLRFTTISSCNLYYVKITAANGDMNAAAGLAASDNEETGNSQDGSMTSLVLVRQNARHLFEPRTPETEVTSSSEPTVFGSSLKELIVVQDECAGCLPLAAMLRPHRTENHLNIAAVAPSPEAGGCLIQLRVVSISKWGLRNVTQHTAPQAFPLRQKRREKVSNARACGSQRRPAGVPQAIRTALYFPAFVLIPQVPLACRRNCGAVRCDAFRNLSVMMETKRYAVFEF